MFFVYKYQYRYMYTISFPEVKVKLHEERLASIGLNLNYSKMKCYIKESKKSEMYHELREAANIPEGFIEGEDGTRLSGLRAYGVPIGNLRHGMAENQRKAH